MTPAGRQQRRIVFIVCVMAFAAHALLSLSLQRRKAEWANVPPAPGRGAAASMALGDRQFAYRAFGLMLQNLGNTGGDTTPLNRYDYSRLGNWFGVEDDLDPRSNFIPLLAAYYFGGTQDPAQLDPVIAYLAAVGRRGDDLKWHWLAQAVYLARFRQNDMTKAQDLAAELAALWHPGMPVWTRAMPALVANQMGDKQAAYELMMAVLKDDSTAMDPAEVNFMIGYICERLLDKAAAAAHPLCKLDKER